MSSGLTPYNISFSDQSPLITWIIPWDSGPNWNVSYTGSPKPDFWHSPNGTSMHSTSEEAAFSLTFTGTAVYVYGHAPQVNYWYNVNYIGRFLANPDPKVGLLFSATDLNYSTNVITCQSGVGGMTITGFIITVGMPLSDNGTKVQTRNVSAFTNDGTLNPVFTTNDPYWGNSTYNDGEYLSIGSSTPSASLSFYLENTTAFAMYGALGSEDGEYTVLVSPDVSLGQTLNTQFNASSQWRAVDQLKYLATNMNSSLSYKVDILNNGQYSHSQFELSNFVLYGFSPSMVSSPTVASSSASTADSTSATTTTTSTSTPSPATSPNQQANVRTSHSTSKGAIAGAVIGVVVVLVAVAMVFSLLLRRRHREGRVTEAIQDAAEVSPFLVSTQMSQHPLPDSDQTITHTAKSTSKGMQPLSGPPQLYIEPSGLSMAELMLAGPSQLTSNNGDSDSHHSQSIVHEVDAGPVIAPPVYNSMWLGRQES